MTKKQQHAPEVRAGTAPRDPTISNDLAARLAFAEEAALKDREQALRYEQFVGFFGALPPSYIKQALSGFSAETIASFLRQIPELPGLVTHWTEQYFESLNRPDLVPDLQRLQSLGVRREPVAIAMMVIKFSPSFDNAFAQFGDSRERRQRAQRILVPVADLRDISKLIGDIPPLISDRIPNPSRIASELKFLASIFDWGEFIYDSLGANHLEEVSKFGLASLVYEKTGMFLDRAVGNLIWAALGRHGYDETRHRVWRIDNYERLQQNVPMVTQALTALNAVLSPPDARPEIT
jgi:hypothetical protein